MRCWKVGSGHQLPNSLRHICSDGYTDDQGVGRAVRVCSAKRDVEEGKHRRVLEDPDEDEVMIGEIQGNEEVEHPRSEVSATEFDDWQQKEYEGKLRELQSQNDFMSIHGAPSSEVANKEVIKTRWVLNHKVNVPRHDL